MWDKCFQYTFPLSYDWEAETEGSHESEAIYKLFKYGKIRYAIPLKSYKCICVCAMCACACTCTMSKQKPFQGHATLLAHHSTNFITPMNDFLQVKHSFKKKMSRNSRKNVKRANVKC